MIKLTILGNPISVNHYLGNYAIGKRVIRFKTKEAKKYQKLCKTLYKGKILLGPLKISMHFYFNNHIRRDLDNFMKVPEDGLIGTVYKDDSQIDEIHGYRHIDKKNPRVEIEIEEI